MLILQVRWKGYGPDEDTWEPIDGLGYVYLKEHEHAYIMINKSHFKLFFLSNNISMASNCGRRIKEFISQGYESKLLPLPVSTN